MDLTKEAIDKIEDLVTQSVVVEVDGKKMSTRDLYPVAFEAVAHPLNVSSLTGFVDFVNRNIDKLDLNANYIAVVTDVYKVSLTSALFGIRKNREILIDAILDSRMESFPFGRFLPQEDFIIKLHSLFQKKKMTTSSMCRPLFQKSNKPTRQILKMTALLKILPLKGAFPGSCRQRKC